MYPHGADLAVTNLLFCTYENFQFDEYFICSGQELFVYDYYSRDVADLCSISCIIFTSLGITNHCKVSNKTFIVTHSTESEVCTFYIVTKMENYLRQILELIGVEFHETISGLKGSQLTIDIIQDNLITYQVKHIAVTIGYINEQFDIHKTRLANILTHINPMTWVKKPLSGPLHERHFSYIHGKRFYPTEEYGHFYQIDLHLQTMLRS